jgi:predicted RNA-binding protein with TRAM domain
MSVPDRLRCLFSARLERHEDSYVFEVPRSEVDRGSVTPGEGYRVALIETPTEETGGDGTGANTGGRQGRAGDRPNRSPPVEAGDIREVTVETLGDEGDGIARIDRGYVLIVPGTEPDQEVAVEIETVRETFAIAAIVDESGGSDDVSTDDVPTDDAPMDDPSSDVDPID